jgi:hypothetical protein
MLPLLLALGSAAGAGAAGVTAVPVGDRPVSADLDGPATLHSGVVIGGSLGVGIGGAAGYPNDSSKIGDGRYYLSGGTMVETSETIFLMGALADYLSFGVWFSHASFDSSGFHARGDAGGLRVEVFPLVRFSRLYPPLSHLGVLGEFGIGQGKLTSSSPGVQNAEGTQSFLAAGAFYEWPFGHLIGGHFAAGPSLEYDSMWSQSFGHEGLVATARLVFYGGP